MLKSKFKSWVINITKNYLIDKWRSSTALASMNNMVATTTNYEGVFLQATHTSGNACFESSNTVNFISTQLSPSDFTLLDMKYVQGYNYNEIGSEFQLTSSTVSNKINYIKTKLKKTISDDDVFE
jgi:RNA polymerase sigma factor (sigma-70 family)